MRKKKKTNCQVIYKKYQENYRKKKHTEDNKEYERKQIPKEENQKMIKQFNKYTE